MVELTARIALESMMRATEDGATPIIRRLARNQARLMLEQMAMNAETAKEALTAELRAIGFDTHADNVAAGETVMLPSYVTLDLLTKAASEDGADPAPITQLDDNSEAMICAGCGTTRTIAGIKAMSKTAFTCCPERKMIPARDMWRVWCATDAPKTASEGTCPFCTGASEYQGSPEDAFCDRHLRLYRKASAA